MSDHIPDLLEATEALIAELSKYNDITCNDSECALCSPLQTAVEHVKAAIREANKDVSVEYLESRVTNDRAAIAHHGLTGE